MENILIFNKNYQECCVQMKVDLWVNLQVVIMD